MKPAASIVLAFAVLSFVALTLYLAADFWLPVLVIVAVAAVAAVLTARRPGG
jgi:hypothetical protein